MIAGQDLVIPIWLLLIIEQYIISRKGAKPAKENKDKFFKNLGVFAPLRENLI
jgi:hypothetical protein